MTTFRKPFKPLPVKRDCPVCLGKSYTMADLQAHNEASALYGERSYPNPRN